MKKNKKPIELKNAKEPEFILEEIPEKDDDGIDIIPTISKKSENG